MIIELTDAEARVIEMWASVADGESYVDEESEELLEKLRAVDGWPSHA